MIWTSGSRFWACFTLCSYEENVRDFNLTSIAKPVNTYKQTQSFQRELGEPQNTQTESLSFLFLVLLLDLDLIMFSNNRLNAKSIDI